MDAFQELIKALDSEDDLGKVIRSQIIIENLLVKFLESQVKDVSYLNKMDLTFEQKTNLALSFGLDVDWASALSCIGNIRNGFAHKLRGQISKQDANNLYKTFTKKNKEITQQVYSNQEQELLNLGFPKYSNMEPVHKFSLYVTVIVGALEAWVKHRAIKA